MHSKLNVNSSSKTLQTKKHSSHLKMRKNRKANSGNSKTTKNFEKEIVVNFLSLLNTVKVYHWKTYSYATHQAADELYSDLNTQIDRFVEVLLGKMGGRVDLTVVKSIPIYNYTNNKDMEKYISKFKQYLIELNSNKVMNIMGNSDLYNIRDEILGDLNQFLYLLTFN